MRPDLPGPPATPYSHAIDLGRFPWTTPLARDYCHAYERLGEFYAGAPSDEASWQQVIAARRASPIDTTAAAAIVAGQLSRRSAPQPAQDSAAALSEKDTVAVVTGQQAGLFGGPLFTLFKALTAIALARRVEAAHGVRAVPVFWIDAEDHDIDEVSSCTVLDASLTPRQIAVDLPAAPGAPVSTLRLPETIRSAVAELREALPPTEFTDPLMDVLGRAYADGNGMVEAFALWLDATLGAHGLVVYDASDPAAKPLVRSVFDLELRTGGDAARLAATAGKKLEAEGYHVQVAPADDAVALFALDGARRPIRQRDGGFGVGEELTGQDTLLDRVRDHPEAFSPNVLLRPIVQDTLFPTVAYVSGPNELAYLGQLRTIYERFDVPMPLFYPRLSATLLDRASTKFLARQQLDLEALQAQDESVLNRLISAQLPPEVDAALSAAQQQVGEHLDAIAELVPSVDPTLSGAAKTTRQRMERDLQTLQNKIVQAAKRRDETLRRQFNRARTQAFPGGSPQERMVGFVYFLNKYGPSFPEQLLDQLPLDVGRHWVVTI